MDMGFGILGLWVDDDGRVIFTTLHPDHGPVVAGVVAGVPAFACVTCSAACSLA